MVSSSSNGRTPLPWRTAPGLPNEGVHVEAIFHEHEKVHVVRLGVLRDEGAEDRHAKQVPGGARQANDPLQACGDIPTPHRTKTEPSDDLDQRDAMDTRRQVALAVEVGERHPEDPPGLPIRPAPTPNRGANDPLSPVGGVRKVEDGAGYLCRDSPRLGENRREISGIILAWGP